MSRAAARAAFWFRRGGHPTRRPVPGAVRLVARVHSVPKSRCFIFFMKSDRSFSKRLISRPCKTGKSKEASPLSKVNVNTSEYFVIVLCSHDQHRLRNLCNVDWSLRLQQFLTKFFGYSQLFHAERRAGICAETSKIDSTRSTESFRGYISSGARSRNQQVCDASFRNR